jgi:hypothetical protein
VSDDDMPMISDMGGLGLTLNEFYLSMIAGGFTPDQALRLTIGFMREMFQAARGTGPDVE